MQELGLAARGERHRLAGGEMDGGERAQRLIAGRAFAADDDIDAFAAGGEARARLDPVEAGFAAPLGEHAEQLLRYAGGAGHRHPLVACRVHEDRLRVARLRIDHRPLVHVLPDRLVAVQVALAFHVGAPPKYAVLELALAPELLHAGLDLGLREIARARGAAELQHDGFAVDVRILALRAVVDRLREVADHAGGELAVAAIVEDAFELVADLLEIVPVARRVEIAAHLPERDLEIVERAGRALHHDAAMEDAAAMLEAALERDVVGLHDFHGVSSPSRRDVGAHVKDKSFGTE